MVRYRSHYCICKAVYYLSVILTLNKEIINRATLFRIVLN